MSHLWRPFSPPHASAPMLLTRGQGSEVADATGRRYIDAAGGLWNVALGQGHARLIEQMQRQLQTLSFGSLFHATNAPAEQLCDRLVALAGGSMQTVVLSTTGSSAVDVALRVARLHHWARGHADKLGIVSFDKGYHGSSLLGLNAGRQLVPELAPHDRLPGFFQVPAPVNEDESLAALHQLLTQRGHELACLILEPVVGSGGILVPSPAYGEAVTNLCRQHDVLLVADEVATGAGRCGAFLASPLLHLKPDIVALSKGLNSGYFPLACTLFSRDVVAPIADQGLALPYGCTQDGNPVGCVTALATLEQLETQNLYERASTLGQHLQQQLRERTSSAVVRQVRGLGLMIGIELMHDDGRNTPFSAAESEHAKNLCQDEGLLTYHFDRGLSLFPALTLDDDEAHTLLDILVDVINQLT